jgi:hypothetical protein
MLGGKSCSVDSVQALTCSHWADAWSKLTAASDTRSVAPPGRHGSSSRLIDQPSRTAHAATYPSGAGPASHREQFGFVRPPEGRRAVQG